MRKPAVVLALVGLLTLVAFSGAVSAAVVLPTNVARAFATKTMRDAAASTGAISWRVGGAYRWSDTEVRFAFSDVIPTPGGDGYSRCFGKIRVWLQFESRSSGH